MSSRPSSLDNKPVRPGIYEIQSSATGLFLNSFEDPVYNGRCDDALTLKKLPTRRGKWKLESVGDGYTIKQVISGLYCALADAEQFIFQSVVLSSVPTVWTIKHIHEESDQVRIAWSVSDVAWEVYGSKDERVLVINGLKPADSSDSEIDEKPEKPSARATFDWNLLPVEMPVADGGKIRPGLYSLQNMLSKTYVMMGPDGKLSCWPKSDFRNGDTKLWDIDPWGEGHTIRLHGTDKYCTLVETMNKGDTLPIHLSTCPATWKILPNESAAHESDDYFQIFWGNTQNTWDLHTPGKDKPGTPVNLRTNNNYNPCRLFRFIP